MITANELTFSRMHNTDSVASWFIKLFISITTAILLGLAFYYHYLNLQLYAAQNGLQNWRVGLTPKKIVFIVAELVVCAIHPMPRGYPPPGVSTITGEKHSVGYTAVDVGLGFPSKSVLFLSDECDLA